MKRPHLLWLAVVNVLFVAYILKISAKVMYVSVHDTDPTMGGFATLMALTDLLFPGFLLFEPAAKLFSNAPATVFVFIIFASQFLLITALAALIPVYLKRITLKHVTIGVVTAVLQAVFWASSPIFLQVTLVEVLESALKNIG